MLDSSDTVQLSCLDEIDYPRSGTLGESCGREARFQVKLHLLRTEWALRLLSDFPMSDRVYMWFRPLADTWGSQDSTQFMEKKKGSRSSFCRVLLGLVFTLFCFEKVCVENWLILLAREGDLISFCTSRRIVSVCRVSLVQGYCLLIAVS